ncbi:hypothetical protein EVAR_13812_1 [Eumeta japonica]|uniref:Uncharacterized protein n=1 Tax=Eumeta variegata TaxID=151549 RepID=A0A4C1U124_EUMVA|nr:hypothetical protein EVAR_13812_1 [Eumeta japonica]
MEACEDGLLQNTAWLSRPHRHTPWAYRRSPPLTRAYSIVELILRNAVTVSLKTSKRLRSTLLSAEGIATLRVDVSPLTVVIPVTLVFPSEPGKWR